MKLKGLLIPNCVLELFYQWCDITGYNKVESNFIIFIEDAALHWNNLVENCLVTFPLFIFEGNSKGTIIKISATSNINIILYKISDEELDWVFLSTYKKYLDEIRERNGTGVL